MKIFFLSMAIAQNCSKTAQLAISRALGMYPSSFAESEQLLRLGKGGGDQPAPPPPPPPPCGTRDGNMRVDCQQQNHDDLTESIYPLFLGIYRATRMNDGAYKDALYDFQNTTSAVRQLSEQIKGTAASPNGVHQQSLMLIQSAELLDNYGRSAQSALSNLSEAFTGSAQGALTKLGSSLSQGIKDADRYIVTAHNLQNKNANVNSAVAVRMGQSTLDSIAAALTASQKQVSNRVTASSSTLTTSASAAQKNLSTVTQYMDQVSGLIYSSPVTLQSSVNNHVQAFSGRITSAQGSITDTAQQTDGITAAQLQSASDFFATASQKESANAANAWSSGLTSTERKLFDDILSIQSTVDSRSSMFQSQASSNNAGLSQTYKSSTGRVVNAHSGVTTAHATLLNNSRSITADLNGLSDAASDAVADANDASAAQTAAVKRILAQLLGSSSTATAQQLNSLLNAVATVQSNSQSKMAEGQSQLSKQVGSLYSNMGSDSADTATSIAGSRTALLTSTNQVNTNLQSLTNKAMMLGGQTASSNLKMLYALGSSAGSSAKSSLKQAKEIALAKSNAIKNRFNSLQKESGAVGNQLQRNALGAQMTSASNGKALAQSLTREGYSADQMKSAMGSLVATLNVHSTVLKQSSDNAASQTARLGQGISDTDARVSSQLQTFVDNAQYLTSTASQSTISASSRGFSSLYTTAENGLQAVDTANTQSTQDARNGQAVISQKLAGLSGQIGVLDGGVNQLSRDSGGKTLSINNTFALALQQQSRVANQAGSTYSGAAFQQMAGVNDWMNQLLDGSVASIEDTAGKNLTSQQSRLSSALNGNANLQTLVAGLSAGINQLNGLGSTQILPLGKSFSDASASAKEHVQLVNNKLLKLVAQLTDMQIATRLLINQLTTHMQSSMSLIPGMLQQAAGGAMTKLSTIDSDIQGEINALRDTIATSKDTAVQALSQSALQVLYKLQAVTAGVVAANDKLLSRIADGKQVDISQLQSLQGSAETIVAAVAAMNGKIKGDTSDVTASTEGVGRQVATLFQGVAHAINQTALEMSSNASSTEVDGDFKLAMARSRNRKRFSGTSSSLGAISSITANHSEGLKTSQTSSREALFHLAISTEALNQSIKSDIERVRNHLVRANASLGGTIGEFDYKSLSQETLVKSTMRSLISLWTEFAGMSVQKSEGFKSRSLDYLSLLDSQLKHAVSNAERRLEAIGVRLHGLNGTRESLEETEEDFEATMSNLTIALADRERNLNARVNSVIMDAREALLWYEGNATLDNQQLRNQVKSSLDHLDEELLGRLNEANQA